MTPREQPSPIIEVIGGDEPSDELLGLLADLLLAEVDERDQDGDQGGEAA